MRATLRSTVILLLVTLSTMAILLGPSLPAASDPWIVNNGNGTSDAAWNFTNPANYSLSNLSLAGGVASLAQKTSWWNSTTAADFSGPSSSTNIDLNHFPGTVNLALTTQSPATLTLQPDPAAGQDSYLDGTPGSKTNNFGTATTMLLNNSGSTVQRPVIRFDLTALPANAFIDGATLQLYENSGVGNSFTADLHYLTTAWNEATVTWNAPWTSAGGDFSGYVATQAPLTNTAGWVSWNVTQLVDLWYRGRLANDGVILTMPSQGVGSQKSFYTSDWTTASQRPQLTINYRVFGATGTYVSKVGGSASMANWATISWNATTVSLVSDEFNGTSLDPKWTWTNTPPSYDVGITTPGSLRVNSSTGVDLWGGTFTGNVLAQPVVGNFTATMKFSVSPTLPYQKAGLMVYLDNRNWYSVGKTFTGGAVNWAVTYTADAVSTGTAYNTTSGNPVPAWVRIVRSGNSFASYVSSDGVAWTLAYTYTPAVEYPLEVRIAFFVADGKSGAVLRPDVDYIRVTFPTISTVTVQTRTGNVNPPDATWSGWSAAYPTPSGSVMSGSASYIEFQLSFSTGPASQMPSPGTSPAVGDVNISWSSYFASGSLDTNDLAPSDLASWGNFTVTQTLNGQAIAYAYSLDSGSSWTSVVPPANLKSVSIASAKIRFRATLSTTNTLVTPTLSEMRLEYFHSLDHFYVTASPTATAGAAFTVTVTAKDKSNNTITSWTGTVSLAARLLDGVTPGGGTLGTTSVAITANGVATLATETYTKAETIRILASSGSATGLSSGTVVSPGALASIVVTPDNVTLLLLDSQAFTAQGYDAWNNTIAGLSYSWVLAGGIGTLNTTTGASVTFTANAVGNGTLTVTSGFSSRVAQIRVVMGTRPWIAISAPANDTWLTGVVTIRYTNSSDSVSVRFEYDGGAGWTLIGTTSTLNGVFSWNTAGLNFTGGSLRAIVTDNRTITNTTVVSPISVDNAPPAIALGNVTDNQTGNGTLTLTYVTWPDVVRVDFSYFDGTWHTIGSDLTIDGTYLWSPSGAINGVTVKAVAVDRANLTGVAEKMGVGLMIIGTNAPSIAAIPTLHIQTGVPYVLNLTYYVSDADTPLSALTIWDSDAANVTTAGGTYPS
ncbi:MAG: DNRLRE domain-containing protein, partial [Candidatus Thermoplasmatota archaeon]